MLEQNLNPDALDVLATVVFSCSIEDWNEHDEDEKRQLLAPYTRIIHAYLSALPAQPDAVGRMFATAMMEVLDAEKLQPGERLVHVNDMQEVLNRLEKNILSALPAHPDTVNSVEELDALPCASVVLNGVTAFQKYGAREPFDWSADGRWYDSTQVELPARVLYRPNEESSDGR